MPRHDATPFNAEITDLCEGFARRELPTMLPIDNAARERARAVIDAEIRRGQLHPSWLARNADLWGLAPRKVRNAPEVEKRGPKL